jgi:hypothetical protein
MSAMTAFPVRAGGLPMYNQSPKEGKAAPAGDPECGGLPSLDSLMGRRPLRHLHQTVGAQPFGKRSLDLVVG